MKKQRDMLIYALIALILVSGIGGYALGMQAGDEAGDTTSIEAAGFDALASKAVSQVTAEVRGKFAGVDGDSVKVQQDGETFLLKLPEGYQGINLSVISALTEADQTAITAYEEDLAAYEKALAEFDANSADPAAYPAPPTIGFTYNSAGTPPGPDGEATVETKTVSQQIGLDGLEEGDVIQATLSTTGVVGPGVDETTSAEDNVLQINYVSAIRDQTGTVE